MTWGEMFGSGVLIGTDLTQALKRPILLVLRQRPIMSVVFAAVRGTAAIRATSGARFAAGSIQIAGSAASVFVFPPDRAKILFSGAAFGAESVGLQF